MAVKTHGSDLHSGSITDGPGAVTLGPPPRPPKATLPTDSSQPVTSRTREVGNPPSGDFGWRAPHWPGCACLGIVLPLMVNCMCQLEQAQGFPGIGMIYAGCRCEGVFG